MSGGDELDRSGIPRLERMLESQPVSAVLPRLYRSRRLRAAVLALDPASELRQKLISGFSEWLYGHFNETGEVPGLIFAEDVELDQAAELLGTPGRFHGRAGVAAALGDVTDAFQGIRFTPQETIAVGRDRFLVLIRFSGAGKQSGIALDRQIAHVATFAEGSISRMEVHWERSEALASLGLPADYLDRRSRES